MDFSKLCPLFRKYEILYPHSARLQISLCDFHAAIIRCCKQAIQVIQRACKSKNPLALNINLHLTETGFTKLFNSFSSSLATEFEPFRLVIEKCSKQVEWETSLAESQASDQERQLQIIERKSASESRASLRSGIVNLRKKTDGNIKFQIERSERDASKKLWILLLQLANKHFRKAQTDTTGDSIVVQPFFRLQTGEWKVHR